MRERDHGTIAVLTTAVTFGAHAAVADVKRHQFIPESLRGSWAPSSGACKDADKSIIVLSAQTYTSSEANCRVFWVSVTPRAGGPLYSARLQCSKPNDEAQKTFSDVMLLPKDVNRISIGAGSELRDYQRCSASEPAAPPR